MCTYTTLCISLSFFLPFPPAPFRHTLFPPRPSRLALLLPLSLLTPPFLLPPVLIVVGEKKGESVKGWRWEWRWGRRAGGKGRREGGYTWSCVDHHV